MRSVYTNIDIDVEGQSEDALQQKCFFWFTNEYPKLKKLLFAVPNGGTRNPREAKKMKATGTVKGVSDLILLYQGKAFLIELKKDEAATQKPEQKEFQRQVEWQGFTYFLIRSLHDFRILIRTII